MNIDFYHLSKVKYINNVLKDYALTNIIVIRKLNNVIYFMVPIRSPFTQTAFHNSMDLRVILPTSRIAWNFYSVSLELFFEWMGSMYEVDEQLLLENLEPDIVLGVN